MDSRASRPEKPAWRLRPTAWACRCLKQRLTTFQFCSLRKPTTTRGLVNQWKWTYIMRPMRFASLICVLLVSLGSLSGCGDSGNAPLAGSGGNTGQFRERVDEYYHGVLAAPPANGPAPAPGKSVWIISCGQAVTSCALPSESMEQAAHQLGWRVTIFDGKLDPSQFTAGMRQAIAADADGIIPVGIDCPLIKAPVEEARRAGIAVVPQVGMDCNDPALKAGPSLFSA